MSRITPRTTPTADCVYAGRMMSGLWECDEASL